MSINQREYNGFTNYVTWKVNFEFVCDMADSWIEAGVRFESVHATATHMKDSFMDFLFEESGLKEDNLLMQLALQTIADVDWYDIAKTHCELWDDDDDDDDDDDKSNSDTE